jgi:hypothetical protein
MYLRKEYGLKKYNKDQTNREYGSDHDYSFDYASQVSNDLNKGKTKDQISISYPRLPERGIFGLPYTQLFTKKINNEKLKVECAPENSERRASLF